MYFTYSYMNGIVKYICVCFLDFQSMLNFKIPCLFCGSDLYIFADEIVFIHTEEDLPELLYLKRQGQNRRAEGCETGRFTLKERAAKKSPCSRTRAEAII